MIHINRNNYSVYVHVFPNEKCYVGITKQNVNDRWQLGEGYKKQPVYDAIKEYGWDNIEHIILYSNLSREEAQNKEIQLIEQLNSISNGYNTDSGGGCGGSKWVEFNYNGKTLNSEEIADLSIDGIDSHDITTRVRCHKWSLEKAMTTTKIKKNQQFLYNGVYYTAKQLAEISNVDGITQENIISRINKHGFDVERAITQPLNVKRQPKGTGERLYEYNGKYYNTYELCRLSNIEDLTPGDITCRINKHGWSVERAISQPKKKRSLFEYNGQTYTSKELAKLSPYDDIDHHVITDRINRLKWSVEKAILTPLKR